MTAPVPSVAVSRTSGLVPLGVTFDATGTTDADTTNPFRDLFYQWSFGDTASGNWSTGTNTALSKNGAFGPVAAHIYESAAEYQWSMLCFDGTTAVITVGTVTASDWPDDANTVCVGNVLPVQGVNGVPSNATCVQSTDFDAVLATHAGANKRILFNRGDAFTSSTTGNISAAGAQMLGVYGTGAKPTVTAESLDIDGLVNINNTAVNDLRIVDLDLIGFGATDTGIGISYGADIDNITILRVDIDSIGAGIVGQGTSTLIDSVIQDCTVGTVYNSSGGNAFFGRLETSAIQGCDMQRTAGGEHVIRVQRAQRSFVGYNTLSGGQTAKTSFTLRADVHSTTAEDTFYTTVAFNKIIGNLESQVVQIGPSGDTEAAHLYDVIFEKNYIINGSAAQFSLYTDSLVRGTIRNNLFDMTLATARVAVCIDYENTAGAPTPDDNLIANNTAYSGAEGTSNFRMIRLGITGTVTNTTLQNNLGYAAGDSVHALLLSGAGVSGTVGGSGTEGNSSDAQIGATDPSFDGPLTAPQGFRIGTGSYAASGGTAVFPASNSDFFNCDDSTANEHIGAFVPRVRAQCRGVAGP